MFAPLRLPPAHHTLNAADPFQVNADLTPEWNTHRLLSDAGILDECLQRAERIMLNRRLAAAREVVADLERQIGGAS